MSKYKVTLEETVLYVIEVEAKDEDEAATVAEEVFVQSEIANEFFIGVKERDAVSIVKL
jgi:hypothetical protein